VPEAKLLNLPDAIERCIPPGSTVVLGTCFESLIPFAAGREIIRQAKSDLTLVGPISDILFDQLIGAGCVSGVRAAWVGNVITGSGYNFRRAVESGGITVEDHTNLTLALALKAGAMGVPFLPTYTALGSDLHQSPGLKIVVCPFTQKRLTAVAAICPDVAVIHVQRADVYGNAHLWGNLGVSREACLASRHILLTAEDIVDSDVIRSDPNRVLTPGFRVSAVVHAPWGAHPSPVPGYYNRDHQFFLDYRRQSRTADSFKRWVAQWIQTADSQKDGGHQLGPERLKALRLQRHLWAEGVDYGY